MLARDSKDGQTPEIDQGSSLDLYVPPSHNDDPQMKLPDDVRDYFVRQGRIGGQKRNENMSSERRSESAAIAARARWSKAKKKSKKAR